jgi:hypothetical protein
MLTAAQQYIEDRIERIPESGCWIWMLACCVIGYGKACGSIIGDTHIYAHRLAWTVYKGPIPDGMKVLHRCDIRCCCNPNHLFLGTSSDNSKDMANKGRSLQGERHPRARMTNEMRQEILSSPEPGAVIAKRLGFSHSTINRYRRGTSWKHLARPVVSRSVGRPTRRNTLRHHTECPDEK